MADSQLLRRFCWTKYGTEAGETIEAILARKEAERLANMGVFLWGIGNSVGPGIRRLVALEREPRVVFSPMRAAAKFADVKPERVVTWTRAHDLNGREWDIPDGSLVTSRANSALQGKRSHYALVCRSDQPLRLVQDADEIDFEDLRNLESGNRLGYSQVTAVVERAERRGQSELSYLVGFVAALVFPYFVTLSGPVPSGTRLRPGCSPTVQEDLLQAS